MFWIFLIIVIMGPTLGGLLFGAWKAYLESRQAALDPFQVLATQYATGQIDEREYAHRLRVLQSGPELEPGQS